LHTLWLRFITMSAAVVHRSRSPPRRRTFDTKAPLGQAVVPGMGALARSAMRQVDAAFTCDRLEEWLQPASAQHLCLRALRPLSCGDMQELVDELGRKGSFGADESIPIIVPVAMHASATDLLTTVCSKGAQSLATKASELGLPEQLCQQIQADALDISVVLKKMVPMAKQIIMKLELLGDNVCLRWHQDHYVGRAIVTYNGHGTVYTRSSNVDFWELNNCGKSECIIHNPAEVFAASTGDVLFMKGNYFPGVSQGLVHRSPDKRYHDDGSVMYRLALKVDLPK